MAKKMKKLFSLILAMSMVMSLLSVVASAEGHSRYDCDCETRHVHGEACYEEQNVCGYAEGEQECELALHAHSADCYKLSCEINAEDDQPDCGVEAHECNANCAEDCNLAHTHGENCFHTHSEIGGACYALNCGYPVEEHPEHVAACYHTHDDDCKADVLICTESVFHVHGKACYAKINGKAWMTRGTFRTYCVEPICEYADMKIHGHEYSCLTEEEKAEMLVSYPESTYALADLYELGNDYSDPYIFAEMQTYLPSGYYYHNPQMNDDSHPQLWMMANLQGMSAGDTWSHNLKSDSSSIDRFVMGESNFAVAYCCDRDTTVVRYTAYRQINLEDANYYDDITAQKIRSVMMNSYPCISVEEMQEDLAAAGFADAAEVDEGAMIAAAQIAVWKYANTDTFNGLHYWYTTASGKYPVLTAHWEKSGADSFQPDTNERMLRVVDYLIKQAEENPIPAPESQIVVSQVEVANLIMTPDENGTYTVDLQVMLNGEFDNSHEDTNIVITASAGAATASVTADGSSVYDLKLTGYTEGDDIAVTMSGSQYLPAGVYFYEPYAAEGQDVRKVSQNMVGLNAGTIPVGDSVTLDAEKLATVALGLKKVNEDGKTLTGAEFTLSHVDAEGVKTALDTYAVDANGELTVDGLMAGKSYELTETKAPEGYALLDGAIKFTVAADGSRVDFDLPDGVTTVGSTNKLEVVNRLESESSDEIEKSKTASPLDANGVSDVKLSVGGSQDRQGSDIVFVVDKSSSDALSKGEATEMLKALVEAQKDSDASIKIGFVIFNYTSKVVLPLTELTEENMESMLQSLETASGGTNIDAGLIAAKEMLDADTAVEASRKHMILVSDGLAWAFNDDNNVPSTIVWKQSEDNFMSGTEGWLSTRKSNGDYVVPNGWTWSQYWAQVKAWVEADGDTYVQPIGDYKHQSYSADKCLTTAEAQDHAMCMDRALYDAWESYTALQNAGYRCYAVNTSKDPNSIGDNLMKMLNGGESLSFDDMQDHVIYAVGKGSKVVDYIGYYDDPYKTETADESYDFDFVDEAESVILTVGSTTYTTAKVDNVSEGVTSTYSFTAPGATEATFTVEYYKDNGTTGEHFVWIFGEDVSNFAPATLSYKVKLVSKSAIPGDHEADTNQEAILYPKDSDGEDGEPEYFEKPTVEYEVPEPTVKPPYNPPAGGGEEELPDEDVPTTDAPVEEEIFEEDPPLADAPATGDMTVLWAAMSVVSAAGLFVVGKKSKDEE
ncbi:MAG: VWA domain-containing protein [Ruminococcaceae bacterium]|nr:VWA domain-containing protein [Oscillospiraceae bacterium]